ncbi:MAG: DUF721 domain-containing protein [Candidatus Omnitrophota bacterium]
MMTKDSNIDAIKNIIGKVVGDIEKKEPGKKERIEQAWKNIVGPEGVKHSRPIDIRKKVLIVEVSSSTWFYALNLKKKSILKDLEGLLEEKIEDIRFRMGDRKA